jgi:hypothetical protein
VRRRVIRWFRLKGLLDTAAAAAQAPASPAASRQARGVPPEAHEALVSRKTVAEVPLTGLSFTRLRG